MNLLEDAFSYADRSQLRDAGVTGNAHRKYGARADVHPETIKKATKWARMSIRRENTTCTLRLAKRAIFVALFDTPNHFVRHQRRGTNSTY